MVRVFSLTEHFLLFKWSPDVFSDPSWLQVFFLSLMFVFNMVVKGSPKSIRSKLSLILTFIIIQLNKTQIIRFH